MKKRKIIIIIAAAVLLLSAIAVGVFFAPRREEPKCDGVTHAWGEWSTLTEPTCTAPGKLERICTLCGEVEARDSARVSHILSDWTDNGEGKLIKTCTVCGEIYATENIYTKYSISLRYKLSDDGSYYRVIGIGNCKDRVIVIPPERKGLPIREIARCAFSECTGIEAVIIPSSVTSIGSMAFTNSSVERVFIPDSVTTIYTNAFSGCPHLESVILPNSLTWLGTYCFSNTPSVKSLIIPQNLRVIPRDCFANSALTSITVPSSVIEIADSAFKDCRDLVTVNLPDSINRINSATFSGCKSLTEIHLPETITSIGESAFADCTYLTSISLPSRTERISAYAFENCRALETVYIPSALTHISENAFLGVDRGKLSLLISPENDNFYTVGTSLIKRDPISVMIGNVRFKGSPDTIIIGSADGSIPTDPRITKIGGCAFKDRLDLREIVIPKNITSIGGGAFIGCPNVTSITYEGTLAEWEKVSLGVTVFKCNTKTVHCTDGSVKIDN